ncbi:MAG: riboflavin synthase [Synechococcus sp.]
MFTGLVQAKGLLEAVNDYQLNVQWLDASPDVLKDLELGDSVAVDGVCLTVANNTSKGFIADISPETLARTSLGNYPADRPVNLERSLKVGGKIGGHFVTGHIDGIGHFCEAIETGDSWELSFRAPAAVARYIVLKGSIAINGISLTVAELGSNGGWFKVAVIPHTFENTNLSALKPSDRVNLEGDILGKYVERFLLGQASGQPAPTTEEPALDLSFLSQHGFS